MGKEKERNNLRARIVLAWQTKSLRGKINVLVSFVFMIILLSLLLDLWTIKVSLVDFNYSLSASEKVGQVVQKLETESIKFRGYTRGTATKEEVISAAFDAKHAINMLPKEYYRIGEEPLAWTQKISKAYIVYATKRDSFYELTPEDEDYLEREYELYEMQDYLKSYAGTLMNLSTQAVNDFYQERYKLLFYFPMVIVILAIIGVFLVIDASRKMNKTLVDPILMIADASKKIADNDFFIPDLEVDNKDEIGDLVHAFNKMKYATSVYVKALEENRVALDRLHLEELQKKEIENQLDRMKFEVLRHQINPHFLFNTLNVISGMANLEDAPTTDKMIKSLSSLLRYNLRTEEKETTLEQELSVIGDYMYLQKMRFGARVDYVINCPEELKGAHLPTFVVQPIVENCIVHGISAKEEGGVITIDVSKKDGEFPRLALWISDTGIGMDEEVLAKLRSQMAENNEDRKAIGVSNIYRRLKLMYPESTMEIESTPGKGTVTTITIPYKGEIDD